MRRVKPQEAQTLVEKNPHDCSIKEKAVQALCDYNEAVTDEEKLLAQKARIKWLNEAVLDNEGLFSTMLDQDEAEDMIRVVSNKEIKDAMFDIGDNRAPSPDGYSSLFFKRAWNIVGNDVRDVVKEFFDSGQMLGELNATLISLVPKIQTPIKVFNFRPIAFGLIKEGLNEFSATSGLFLNLRKSTLFFGSLKDKEKEKIKKASVFKLTKTAVKEVNNILKRFLWSNGDSAKGKAKIAWKNVCRPKEYGDMRDKITDRLQYEIYDGTKVSLWYDKWHSSGLLINHVTNRDLYDARIPKMISISDMIDERDSNYLIHSYRIVCFETFGLVPAKSNSYYQAFNVESLFGEIVSPKKSQVKLKCQIKAQNQDHKA
nr:hypothetical protein [Tanacetum cinerariifolium]